VTSLWKYGTTLLGTIIVAVFSLIPTHTIRADDAAMWELLKRLDNIVPENKAQTKKLIESIIEQAPGTKFYYYALGLQAMSVRDYITAQAHFKKSVQMDPNFYYGHFGIGVALGNLGLLNESTASLNRAIALKKNFIPAYSARAWIKNTVKNYTGAIADYTIAIQLAPPGYEKHLSHVYKNRGRAKYRLKNFTGSVADYTQAIRMNPAYTDAYYGRAKSWGFLRKKVEACDDLKKARELGHTAAGKAFDKYCVE
jgi:tetratricopeptide (TPR) repeat protein